MALKTFSTKNGLARMWHLVDSAMTGTGDSHTAITGLHVKLATVYIITSNTPNMTIKIWESPTGVDGSWVKIDEFDVTENVAYRMHQPFLYFKVEVSSHTTGQIDQITILGLVD